MARVLSRSRLASLIRGELVSHDHKRVDIYTCGNEATGAPDTVEIDVGVSILAAT